MMTIAEIFLPDYKLELATTRKILASVDMTLAEFKPHEKSMTMGRLATHVAEIPGWMNVCLVQHELDFAAGDFKPVILTTTEELLEKFDKGSAEAIEILSKATDDMFAENWTMRSGNQIFFTLPKLQVVRTWVLNHHVHHRAQLGVYLRLNNIPVPSSYGPSADDSGM